MAMYSNCKSAVSVNGTIGDAFEVKVGVHQGSVLSPLLIIIVIWKHHQRNSELASLGSYSMLTT